MPCNKIKIVFRTDGNNRIGMGHLMRCLALAEEIEKRSDCDISFLIEDSDGAVGKISECGYSVETDMEKGPVDIIITSLPEIGDDYIARLKKQTKVLVCMDDSRKRRFSADIVVRGSIVPELHNYDADCGYRFLIGPDFMILNKKFQEFNNKDRKTNPAVKSILITMGGSDINNLTPKVMSALEGLEHIKKTAVLGPAFRDSDKIRSGSSYILKHDISNMSELMFFSDIVIAGGGIALYELACLGIPGIILAQTEYQLLEANCFEEQGAIVNLGPGKDVTEEEILSSVNILSNDREKRERMGLVGKKLVDAKAVDRVATEILREIQ